MPFQRVNIRKEMETLKHLPGGHDQRTHGRRGNRGGGGAAAIFARQKAQLDSLSLTPEQRADLESRLERASQHAAETDEMRQARLYDKDGNYTADIPTRRAFYDEMNKRGQQLAQDIQRDDPTQNNHTRVMQRAREIMQQNPGMISESLESIAAKLNAGELFAFTGSSELDDLIRQHHAYRAGMELVIRTYFAQPEPARLNTKKDKFQGLTGGNLETDIAPYVHMAPPDSVPFRVDSFAYNVIGAYAYYEPANVPQLQSDGLTISTVPTLYISGSADASKVSRIVHAHEFGHHVEHTKVGGYTIADTYTRKRMGDEAYNDVVRQCDNQADKYGNDTRMGSLQQTSTRNGYFDMDSYSTTVYRGVHVENDQYGIRREIGRTTTTEVLSVFYEKLAQPIRYSAQMQSQFFLSTMPGGIWGEAASHQAISYYARRNDGINTFAHLYGMSHY